MLFETLNGNDNEVNSLKEVKKIQPNRPLYMAEFWSGWFDNWGGTHHKWAVNDYGKHYENIVNQMNSSINIYMFIGGTNFGWNAGESITTSYDYDAPLSESGQSH